MACPNHPVLDLPCAVKERHADHAARHDGGWVYWEDPAAPPPPPPIDRIPSGGKVGSSHPETSRLAAQHSFKGQKRALYDLVVAAGENGLTVYEASLSLSAFPNQISPNQLATRMGELREIGLVTRLDITRPTTPGNHGHVHVVATPPGVTP